MVWQILVAGFTLGMAGSLHCVVMCGPLSLVLPTHHLSPITKFISLFLYQIGRIITYSIFGLLFGLLGRTIFMAGFQQWFSVIIGSLVLIFSVLYFIRKRSIHFAPFSKSYLWVQKLLGTILKQNSGLSGFLILGMANGLLPCGMVYIALAAVVTMTHIGNSMAFMAMFGAGTLPAMLIMGYAGQLLKPQVRTIFNRSVPFFITATGIILLLRGLNLGIQFISPELPHSPGQAISCFH